MTPAAALSEMRRTLGADNGPKDPFRVMWDFEVPAQRARMLERTLSPARIAEFRPGHLAWVPWAALAPDERAAVKALIARAGCPGLELRRTS